MENDEKKPDDQEVRKLAEQIAAENLQEIKKKLDDAYARRDEALAKADELARKSREQELAALEASGKTTEALQARLKDSIFITARKNLSGKAQWAVVPLSAHVQLEHQLRRGFLSGGQQVLVVN